MKKILIITFAIALTALCFTACDSYSSEEIIKTNSNQGMDTQSIDEITSIDDNAQTISDLQIESFVSGGDDVIDDIGNEGTSSSGNTNDSSKNTSSTPKATDNTSSSNNNNNTSSKEESSNAIVVDFVDYVDSSKLETEYNIKMGDAIDTLAIAECNMEFADLWLNEVRNAYSVAMEECSESVKKEIKADYVNWENNREAYIEQIRDEYMVDGAGTIAQIDVSSKILYYYREKALDIYRHIYDEIQVVPFAYSK